MNTYIYVLIAMQFLGLVVGKTTGDRVITTISMTLLAPVYLRALGLI